LLLLSYLAVYGILADPGVRGFVPIVSLLHRAPRDFAHAAIWVIYALGGLMFVSNLALAKHEGARPTHFLGTFLGLFAIAGTGIAYYIAEWLDALRTSEPALRVFADFLSLFMYCALDYMECIMFGMIIMGAVAAKWIPVYDKDYIIIPGCSIRKDGGLFPLIRGRVNKAIRYAWDQETATDKKVCFVPSGGKGTNEVMSEGSAMEFYLLSHGAEPDEVFAEKDSRNTYENFLFSKKIIDDLKPNARVAFSTTNYHVLRCGMLAKRIGFEHVEGIASRTKWYFWPNGFAREVVAMLKLNTKWQVTAAVIVASVCLALSL
ncbi:MAG: YdcF family protein, partial [Lachnospiraceae bacterium]|nr:YdcF family protein [Lachnospiraceae bacterium]